MRARAAALLTLALVLAGCSQDPNSVAGQAAKGDEKGYISQSGSIEHLPVDKRKAPIELTGTTLDGSPWKSADARGKVVVLNVWGSWCPPCDAEQPELSAAYSRLRSLKLPVVMMGVDNRDSQATAKAYHDAKKVPYPSLRDDGTQMAMLQGLVPSPPVTLVLDRQGRVAGRISGGTTATTLVDLVQDVAKDAA